jgi:tyrosine-protein kinase Etk/Wzc
MAIQLQPVITAKLDEAKEGQVLQQLDMALPPDRKSKPSGALIAATSNLLALLGSAIFVVIRRYTAWSRTLNPQDDHERSELKRAWRWRG